MTEYVVLFVGDADRWWTTMSLEERKAGYTEFQRFGAELTRRGHQIVGGAELHSTADAKRIAPGGGAVTDGPFTEVTEQVGGFYQIRTDDLDDLMDCCQIVAKIGEGVEVRRTVQPEDRPEADAS